MKSKRQEKILELIAQYAIETQEELLERLDKCLPREKETALALLETYLCSHAGDRFP